MVRKLCECGCGQPAPLATMSNKKCGHVQGQPVRFIHGHHARRPLPKITKVDLAWLSGLLEGEGSFLAIVKTRRPRNGEAWQQSYFKIQVGMTDEDVIAKAATLMGAGYWGGKPEKARLRPIFATAVTGGKAEALAQDLLPHLCSRRKEQIETALRKVRELTSTQPVWPRSIKRASKGQSPL